MDKIFDSYKADPNKIVNDNESFLPLIAQNDEI